MRKLYSVILVLVTLLVVISPLRATVYSRGDLVSNRGFTNLGETFFSWSTTGSMADVTCDTFFVTHRFSPSIVDSMVYSYITLESLALGDSITLPPHSDIRWNTTTDDTLWFVEQLLLTGEEYPFMFSATLYFKDGTEKVLSAEPIISIIFADNHTTDGEVFFFLDGWGDESISSMSFAVVQDINEELIAGLEVFGTELGFKWSYDQKTGLVTSVSGDITKSDGRLRFLLGSISVPSSCTLKIKPLVVINGIAYTGYDDWKTDIIVIPTITKESPVANVQSHGLAQNYPNPFNPTTNINYSVAKIGNVELTVFDLMGKQVATLVNEVKSAGQYTITFNGNDLSTGVYFYTLKSGDQTTTKRMSLVK